MGFRPPGTTRAQDIAGLEPLHEQVFALLGPAYEKFYKPMSEAAEYGLYSSPPGAFPLARGHLTDGVDAFTIRPKRNPHWRLRADALHHTVDCALAVSIKGPLP